MRAASPFLLLILCCSGKAAYSHRYLYLYSAVLVQVGAFLLPASQHDEKVNVGMETSAPLWSRRSSSLTSPFASTSTFTSLRAPARLQRSKLLILLVRVDAKGCDNDSDSDSARSTAASGSRTTTRTSTGTMGTSTNTLVELPVFPLRKFPRLPTDRLTLNLYEERYLQMAESILLKAAQTQSTSTNSTGTGTGTPLFGALFVAGKPQLVTGGGRGPIVPLVEAGDIGTVFVVSDWEEALVPTIGNQILRRRIKLNAIGITRFRIDSIVSDGTGVSSCTATTSSTTIQQQRQQQQPYILANATLLSDNTMADPWDDEDDEYLYKTLREILQEADDSRRKGSTTTTTTRSSFSMADEIEMLTTTEPPALVEFAQVFAAIREIMNHSQDDGDEEDYSDSVSYHYYEECLSFFATSLLLNAKQTPAALVPLLELQSTRERIYRLLKLLNKQRT